MIEVHDLHKAFGAVKAVNGVSFAARDGEITGLLGPNGAGKTTTLRAILGLTRPRRGRVVFAGQDVTRWPTHRIARSGIGWVPDDRRVFPALTVARNLAIAQKKSRFRAWSRKECFELFSALEYLQSRECENLSGGEMQMVAIARVLIGGPGLVLLDEPSQGLAPRVVQDVLRAIARLRSEGVAVLMVEQNVDLAVQAADRAYVLDRGRVTWAGYPHALRTSAAAQAMTQ